MTLRTRAAGADTDDDHVGPRHEPVFLLAPARSYSTVIVALLGGHPGIFSFPELMVFTASTVGEALQGIVPEKMPTGWDEEFRARRRSGLLRVIAELHEGDQDEPAIQRAGQWLAARSAWPARRLMDYLLGLVFPKIGLEKSPETSNSLAPLMACIEAYPQGRFIHLTRHPVTTMRSAAEYCWYYLPHATMAEKGALAAANWYSPHARITRELANLPAERWMRVRAEDLLRAPGTWLPQILGWLGLPSDAGTIARMTRTEGWQFASNGPTGTLHGGDDKFFSEPALRPVPEPGPILFDEAWELPAETRERITRLAKHLGY